MSGKFSCAEGIRGIACLIVLVLHSVTIFYYGLNNYFAAMANIGVWLFFVLSAFLLTKKLESDGLSFWSVSLYAIGRVFRIVPIFSLFVVFYFYCGTAGISSLEDVLSAISLQKGYVHLWTIPVEFKFYAVLPFLAFSLIFLRNAKGAFFASIACMVGILSLEHALPYEGGQDIGVWRYVPCFALGVFAALIHDHVRAISRPWMSNAVLGLFVVGFFAISPGFLYLAFGIQPDFYLRDKIMWLGAACAMLVVFCVNSDGVSGVVLRSAPLKYVGRWSFSIYLGHWFVVMKIAETHHEDFAAFCASLVLSVIFGALVFYFVESPIEKVRHRIVGSILRRTDLGAVPLK